MTTSTAAGTSGQVVQRLESNPMDYVGILSPTHIYIGVKSREAFDSIAMPVTDRGETADGHVLVKSVSQNGVTVVFQHWVKQLTIAATQADIDARREAAKP